MLMLQHLEVRFLAKAAIVGFQMWSVVLDHLLPKRLERSGREWKWMAVEV